MSIFWRFFFGTLIKHLHNTVHALYSTLQKMISNAKEIKPTEFSLFCCIENSSLLLGLKISWNHQLNWAHFCGRKINWIQLCLLPRKSTEFSSFYCQENQLNWAHFCGWKIKWIKLVLLPRKSTKFSLFYCPENQLNSAHFCGRKIKWIQLVLLSRKSIELSSFFW